MTDQTDHLAPDVRRPVADDWPIAAAMLPFPSVARDGVATQEAPAELWGEHLREVRDAGFALVDITDSWVRPGDLATPRLDELSAAADEAGVRFASISAIRRSVIDVNHGAEYKRYSHRTIDAAAQLQIGVVSVGLHQALTEMQRRALWFWTVEGHRDRPEDWDAAVQSFRELGRHAEEVGVVLSLEMYEDTFLGTADSAVRLVEAIGLESDGLNPDIGNLVRLHRPIEAWLEIATKTAPYANFWHMKNYARDEGPSQSRYFAVPSPMASGVIDYRSAFRVALEAGFQGVTCAENYGGDGLSVCAMNQEYLRRHVLPKRHGYGLGRSRVRQSDLERLLY